MIQPDISKLIDNRNKSLWNMIIENNIVSIQYHNELYYQVNSIQNNITFLVPHNNYCKDSFTHELLHIDLSMKGVNTYGPLFLSFRENKLLSGIFSNPLLTHVSNTLEHVKMFPKYIEMGFDRTKFIADYDEPKCTVANITELTLLFRNSNTISKFGADQFVGRYFSIRACPNNTINYTVFLAQMRTLNSSLFDLLDDFWNIWLNHNLDRFDVIYNNYRDVILSLYDSLNNWALSQLSYDG